MASPYCYVNLCPQPPPCPPTVIEFCTTEKVVVNGTNLNSLFEIQLITKYLRCATDPFTGVTQNCVVNVDANLFPSMQDRKVVFPVSFNSSGTDTLNAGQMSGNVNQSSVVTSRDGKSILLTLTISCLTVTYDINPPVDAEVFIAPSNRILACPDCLYNGTVPVV